MCNAEYVGHTVAIKRQQVKSLKMSEGESDRVFKALELLIGQLLTILITIRKMGGLSCVVRGQQDELLV